MHKCPNCGQEYEGKFCPDCGAQWQDEKICPNCGVKLNGSARFCNECGYSFTESANVAPETKKPSGVKQKLNAIGSWVKTHLKIVIPVAAAVLIAIILAVTIPLVVAAKYNGTYYQMQFNGEVDKTSYLILRSGNWEDDDGEKGTYKTNGDKIILYIKLFGQNEELAAGTISNGVLTLDTGGGANETYVSESHKHEFSEWKTVTHNCLADGLERRECACGVKEEQSVPAVGHHAYGKWETVNYNCITGGTKRRTCRCGDYEEEALEATGSHTVENWTVTKEAGWSVFGEETGTCSFCGECVTRTIDRLAVDFYEFLARFRAAESYTYTVADTTSSASDSEKYVLVNRNNLYFLPDSSVEGIYYEKADGKIYKYTFESDLYYHKTLATEEEYNERLNMIDFANITITGYDEDAKEYTVILNEKTCKMKVKKKSIEITDENTVYTLDQINETKVDIPDDSFVKDET